MPHTHISTRKWRWGTFQLAVALVNKGMCLLLFHVFKHLLLRKADVLKPCRKSKFLRKKIYRNPLALKNKKVQGIFSKMLILALLSSTVFCLQNHLSDFKLFCSGNRRLLSEFLRIWVDFRDIVNGSPNILAKN